MSHTRSTTCSHRRGGYTMIELMIVVLIMGILAATAAPRLQHSISTTHVDAAAKRIAADLNLARARAIMRGSAAGEQIRFYPADEKYELVDVADVNRVDQTYWVDLAETNYPVDLVSASFTNDEGVTENTTVTFNLHGQPSSGTSPSAPLTNGQIVVSYGGQQRTVVIDPVTGKARVL